MKKVDKSKSKTKLKLKDPKRPIIILAIIILILSLVVKKINTPIKPSKLALLVNNQDIIENLNDQVLELEGNVYFSLEDIKKCFDEDLYQENGKIILSSPKKIAVIELEKDTIEINGATVNLKVKAFKDEQGTIYLPVAELKNVYDFDFSYSEYYKNIIIDFHSNRLEKAYTTKKVAIKTEKNVFSSTLEIIEKDSWVVYLSEENGWAKIRTQNGNIGYIKARKLKNFAVEREEFKQKEFKDEDTDFKQDISKKNIETYEYRKETIDDILVNAVSKQKKIVKIIYNKEKESESYKRFKIESKAILAECGIIALFEE